MRRLCFLMVAVALAGCGAGTDTGSTEPSEAEPAVSQAPASTSASATPGSSAPLDEATLVIVDGVAPGGSGLGLADAIVDAMNGEPVLVNGTLMKDTDGTIWLCDYVELYNPPSCIWPRLQVENYPDGGAEWDVANAADTGLQEQDGVLWIDSSQLYGEVRP